MGWLAAVSRLRAEREPGVLLTVASVRGHAPREAGAKMVVAASGSWGSIGGGNLEETCVRRARDLLAADARSPEVMSLNLSDRARTEHGRQCCGGEVEVLLEPLPVVPAVAIFGLGHVGLELARILSRLDLDLWLVDSRPEKVAPFQAAERPGAVERSSAVERSRDHNEAVERSRDHKELVERPGVVERSRDHESLPHDPVAHLHPRHAVVPELVLGEVPAGTDVLIMTHDHAEDFALCDAALRCGHLGSVGLIGSDVKAKRFARQLAEAGLDPSRIRTPIGLPGLAGKEPAVIAVSVAAELLRSWQGATSDATATLAERP